MISNSTLTYLTVIQLGLLFSDSLRILMFSGHGFAQQYDRFLLQNLVVVDEIDEKSAGSFRNNNSSSFFRTL